MKVVSIPGRLLARAIGILELCIAVVVMGAYIYAFTKLVPYLNAKTAVFGIYFALTMPTSSVLIFATLQVVSLKYRKLIAIVWCVVRTIIIVVAFILLVTTQIFTKGAWLIVLLMAIWLVSLCGVSMYVYGLINTLESKMVGLEMIKMKTESRNSSDNLHTLTIKDFTNSLVPAHPPQPNQLPEISAS